MAVKAVFRKNRADVSIEIQWLLSLYNQHHAALQNYGHHTAKSKSWHGIKIQRQGQMTWRGAGFL
jgi:hypothetical protein